MLSNPDMTFSRPGTVNRTKPNKALYRFKVMPSSHHTALKAKRENKVTIVLIEALCPTAISHYMTLYRLTGTQTAL